MIDLKRGNQSTMCFSSGHDVRCRPRSFWFDEVCHLSCNRLLRNNNRSIDMTHRAHIGPERRRHPKGVTASLLFIGPAVGSISAYLLVFFITMQLLRQCRLGDCAQLQTGKGASAALCERYLLILIYIGCVEHCKVRLLNCMLNKL